MGYGLNSTALYKLAKQNLERDSSSVTACNSEQKE